jgi:NADP-dependent aldehyde dehydrogenase
LFDLAARREMHIPVYAEMGSVNPVVLLPSAVRERPDTIARDLAASLLLGGGQFCTKPGIIFVLGPDQQPFIDALAGAVAGAPQVTMLNRSLHDTFAERQQSIALASGVKTIVAGQATGFANLSPSLFETTADVFLREPALRGEVFGPAGLVVVCETADQAIAGLQSLGGNLTGTVHIGRGDDPGIAARIMRLLETSAGRVIVNGYPTGVEVCRAMVHGGPYPATTDSGTTSVGSAAIRRFVRPVAFQNTPQSLLPPALRDDNPLGINRLVNGQWTARAIASQEQ